MNLVLLDVDGLLGCKVDNLKQVPKGAEYVQCPKYVFVLRPGIRDFLKKLRKLAILGIFSSATQANMGKILARLDPNFKTNYLALLDRSWNTLDPDYGLNETTKPYHTVKLLTTLWSHPMYNSNRRWSAKNTLIIDDTPEKMRFNPEKNVLLVSTFRLEDYEDNELDLLYERIVEKLALIK